MKTVTKLYLSVVVAITFVAPLVLAMCVGCKTVPDANGVPNLEQFSHGKNLWRGGQPTAQGWAYLLSHGVTNVVKLNEYHESYDTVPAGVVTNWFPIGFLEQAGVQRFEVWGAVKAIKPGTFVHCTHGQDRTGLVVACYRRRVEFWSRQRAETEMLAHGFHKALRGLWEKWEAQP